MSRIRVESYAGYRAEERPLRFTIGDRTLEVETVEDQWYGPCARYFRVRASDGNVYVLQHDEEADGWCLVAFRSRGSMPQGPLPGSFPRPV